MNVNFKKVERYLKAKARYAVLRELFADSFHRDYTIWREYVISKEDCVEPLCAVFRLTREELLSIVEDYSTKFIEMMESKNDK